MAISDLISSAQVGVNYRTINPQPAATAVDGAVAAEPAPAATTKAQPAAAEPANESVAVRASTGQARISNALTRAEAVALYRAVAGML